ncbi:photosystem I reaction centre subunit IX / PsaJ [Rubidibacter lacunae KORDI 51-2]|uniref:Photosystem I reaction centre subunit IX / PsaJ n=1 Tax=Rubidibacter lacunae KORDI 51-2 TaxID=582515 RepID=U5D8J3_9CHRO|nr:photosystem I reaction centre subunit IX / PsaJ [Rubidibacter lacunae]ERN40933.1 photosystem I reaction centre subunit IX / PsaJ [Rubidibacter lacunae KORDI 51-2]
MADNNNFLTYLSTAPVLATVTVIVLAVIMIALNNASPDLLSL